MKGQIETDASTETDCEKRRNDKQKNNTRKEKRFFIWILYTTDNKSDTAISP